MIKKIKKEVDICDVCGEQEIDYGSNFKKLCDVCGRWYGSRCCTSKYSSSRYFDWAPSVCCECVKIPEVNKALVQFEKTRLARKTRITTKLKTIGLDKGIRKQEQQCLD